MEEREKTISLSEEAHRTRKRGWLRRFLIKAWQEYRGLKGKIFFALAITVLGVIISTFLVLNYFLRRQVFDTLNADVQRAAKLFIVLQERDQVQLLEKGKVWASVPQLKAALDDEDRLNLQLILKQLYQGEFAATPEPTVYFPSLDRVKDERSIPAPNAVASSEARPALQENHRVTSGQASDLCLIYNRAGRLLTKMMRATGTGQLVSETASSFSLPDSLLSTAWSGQERFVTWKNRDGAWWGVLVPVWAGGSPFGPSVIGAIALGIRLDDNFARHMKELVGAEVAFLFAQDIVAASIFDAERQQVTTAIATNTVRSVASVRPSELATANENFLAIGLPLFEGESAGNIILFRSIDRSIQPLLRPVQRTLFIVGLGAFLAALAISLIISRTITHPIAKLVDAAHAAGAGQLDQPIQISSADEIGYLARRFEAMRQSLKQQMEKLTELNANLSERNIELETALDQLRRAQEELVKSEKLAAAGKLTAQLSHEINNPIHNIRSCLETALKKMPEQLAGRQFVQLAHDEILRIGKLVRQMLDFYRFGQMELHPLDLNQTIIEVLDSSQRRFEERRIVVARRLADNLPSVRASRDQMKQVFLNLILNAVEAMPSGGKIEVRTWSENGAAQIAIRDTGCGIPPENLPKIFDTFFTTKRAVHGVGLGLSVCYNIVHHHGGTIEVESEVGKGSTFTVKLLLGENMEPASNGR